MGGKTDHGADFCEIFGWYGDGICDPFCTNPDPDCSSDEPFDWCEAYDWYGDGICDEFCLNPDPDCAPQHECEADSDCENGYCESFASCLGMNCPPAPPNACVFPDCDDDSQLMCRMMIPNCPGDQVAAVRDGCYVCVDGRSCGDPDPDENECTSDADCANGFCDIGVTCFGPGCPPPPPNRCVVPDCNDGTDLRCNRDPLTCPVGETLAVRDHCYHCVDAHSCEDPGADEPECGTDADCPNGFCEHYFSCLSTDCPPAPPSQCVFNSCDDDSVAVCEMLLPSCPEGQVVSVIDGCFECRDARTCEAPDLCEGAHLDARQCLDAEGAALDASCCEGMCQTDSDCNFDQGCHDDGVCGEPDDCRANGCGDGTYCTLCWVNWACIPDGAVC